MDQWAFFDEVKAGTVRNAYLFYGPEAYIRKSVAHELHKAGVDIPEGILTKEELVGALCR